MQILKMSDQPGVWEMKFDLQLLLGLEDNKRSTEILKDIDSMRISASYKDANGDRTTAELLLLAHYSPLNHHIKVDTSTSQPKVKYKCNTVINILKFLSCIE
ncbi:hypothetical protein LSTR_LSTR016470 [Laodelphax striatellus]|uniref:Uncharacterized protein n=1 Tax=Laodelphax striatellus TaxID=195883 RepID=A0A482XNJ5_LAOST|nr:hypothetical protein LSTR_LSTR016470 [Laodelphax striatellus]